MVEILILDGDDTIKDWRGALHYCGEGLYQKGWVTEDFANACIAREQLFPTGLPSEEAVAIPHSEAKNVIQSSLCFLRLQQPIIFQRMDDPTQAVSTRLVVNMAIGKEASQVKMLQRLIRMLKSKEKVQYFLTCSPAELLDFVHDRLHDEEGTA